MKNKKIRILRGIQSVFVGLAIFFTISIIFGYDRSMVLSPTSALFTFYLFGLIKACAISLVSLLSAIFIEIRLH